MSGLVNRLRGIVLPSSAISLEDRLKLSGCIGRSPFITEENFRMTRGPGPCDLFSAQFPVLMNREDLLLWGREKALTPACIEDLVFVAPDDAYHGNFPLLATGSCCLLDEEEYVPYMSGVLGSRAFELISALRKWNSSHRFLFYGSPSAAKKSENRLVLADFR